MFYQAYKEVKANLNLTNREVDVLACMLSGKTAKEIGLLLPIAPRTVETNIQRIMAKMQCNRKGEVIQIVESSLYFHALKQHYVVLLMRFNLREKLKLIARLKQGQLVTCLLIDVSQEVVSTEAIEQVHRDLKTAGVTIVRSLSPNDKPVDYTIYISQKIEVEDSLPEDPNCAHVAMDANYPLSILSLLASLFPKLPISQIVTDYKTQWYSQNPREIHDITQPFLDSKHQGSTLPYKYFIGGWISLIILFLAMVLFLPKSSLSIRPNLPIPIKEQLLSRLQLLKKIDRVLKKQEGIQTAALLGIGGSGKTTIARQYATQQKMPVIWELNAETPDTLLTTFEDLAYGLSKTAEEKDELETIKKIEKIDERTKKLLFFIKPKLKAASPWLLLLDNVNNLNDIKELLPKDTETWGEGKALLTSRNYNIKDHIYVGTERVVFVQDLSTYEKADLFTKILIDNKTNLTPKHRKEIATFLKYIPSFPLDISIAAHYLKNTKISYKAYLEHIHKNDNHFEHYQEKLLQEIMDYTKTRYGIITCSVKALLEKYPEFIEPLLLLCLIEPHNIPKALLCHLKDKAFIDHFIYQMRKHALLTFEGSEEQPVLSIHPTTQEIMRHYFHRLLTDSEKKYTMDHLIAALEKYSDSLLFQGSIPHLRELLRNLFAYASHKSFLTELQQALVATHIGRLTYHLGHDTSRAYTEKGFILLKKHFRTHHHSIARALLYLGIEETRVGNYGKAECLLKESLTLYDKFYSQRTLERAYALLTLGYTYTYLGIFDKAKDLLEKSTQIYHHHKDIPGYSRALVMLGETLFCLGDYKHSKAIFEQVLNMHKKQFKDNYPRILWTMVMLGYVHKCCGEYLKAEQIIQEADKLYQKLMPANKNTRGWVLMYLSDVKRLLGLYDQAEAIIKESLEINEYICGKDNITTAWRQVYWSQLLIDKGQYLMAKNLLKHCYKIHKKNYKEGHPKIGWVASVLANAYKFLGNYKKSEEFFDLSLSIYAKHYGKQHIDYALVLGDFGHLFVLKGDYEKAKDLINQALTVLQAHNHKGYYKCLEYLGDRHLLKKQKEQAHTYFQQALAVIKGYFPKKSIHLIRLNNKLKS